MRGSSADINKAISYAAYRLFEFMHVVRALTPTPTPHHRVLHKFRAHIHVRRA